MLQHSFEFRFDAHLREDDFIVSSSNHQALSVIESWPCWQSHALFIYGAKGCGKTHLASLWQQKSKACILEPEMISQYLHAPNTSGRRAVVIEDVQYVKDEVALFHLFNAIQEEQGFMLLTSDRHPSALQLQLPDLISRLNASPSVYVDAPDDGLLRVLLTKHFVDRQLKVDVDVIDFLMKRIDRSFIGVRRVVDLLDREALQQKRNITIPFIRELIA